MPKIEINFFITKVQRKILVMVTHLGHGIGHRKSRLSAAWTRQSSGQGWRIARLNLRCPVSWLARKIIKFMCESGNYNDIIRHRHRRHIHGLYCL